MAGTGAAVRNERVAMLKTSTDASGNDVYSLMGTGFESLDDALNPEVDEVTYISDTSATKTVTSYAPEFAFDATVIKDDAVITFLRGIGKALSTGAAAESKIVTYDVWDVSGNVVDAVQFNVAVAMDSIGSGAGGEKLGMSGTILAKGDAIPGSYDTSTDVFTAT